MITQINQFFYLKKTQIETFLPSLQVTPDVILANQRYGMRLEVPCKEGMAELMLRCTDVSTHTTLQRC